MAGFDFADAVELRQQGLLVALLSANVGGEQVPGVGGNNAAPAPLEQLSAAFRFQQAQGAAHGRGIHAQRAGGAAHRADLQNLHEVSQAARFQLVHVVTGHAGRFLSLIKTQR